MLTTLTTLALRIRYSERGASMVEYGLLVALIAVVVIVALGPLGNAIRDLFNNVTNDL